MKRFKLVRTELGTIKEDVMTSGNDWQCENCGDHPNSFVGNMPSSSGKCPATGYNHVWEMIEKGPTSSSTWQCKKCGSHPNSFVGDRPSSSGKCPATGFKHVWKKIG